MFVHVQVECRPLAVSMGNAIKLLKLRISQVGLAALLECCSQAARQSDTTLGWVGLQHNSTGLVGWLAGVRGAWLSKSVPGMQCACRSTPPRLRPTPRPP